MTRRLESLQATWALSTPAFSLLRHVVLVVGGGVVVGVGGIVGVGNLTKICTNLWPPLIASGVEHFGRFIGGGFLDVDARVTTLVSLSIFSTILPLASRMPICRPSN